ncbi:hypothetical protein CCMSSC00406_0006977 [Pleurotus cornucopiae]|uniref:Uncharacterized protein n=1 Tax=Pleurotus cornucopiae TaxID=5321 RepID=A0ACB7J0F8_PLECO|nr:hypothetical protein CCMSSC00406_0006977 [Pleurotus cornucopiae]
MANVYTLLTLPQTSNGLTSFKSSVTGNNDDELTARKAPRLESDLDSASASRTSKGAPSASTGPFQIKLVGYNVEQPLARDSFVLLKRCLRVLLSKNPTEYPELPLSYVGIYDMCRAMVCDAELGDGLYEDVILEVEKCFGALLTQLDAEQEHIQWLSNFVECCAWFEKQIALLSSLFTYLDQVHVKPNPTLQSIRELAFTKFGDRILSDRVIVLKLHSGVKDVINAERGLWMTNETNRTLISNVVSHLTTHHEYASLEIHYLEFTKEFYLNESREQAASIKNAKEFFKQVDRRIDYEVALCKEVLCVSSWSVVRETTERALMEGRGEWLANEALRSSLAEMDTATLGKMYKLFTKVGVQHLLKLSFRKYVSDKAKQIVTDTQMEDNMVMRLLELKKDMDRAVTTSFVDQVSTPPTSQPGLASTSTSSSTPIPNKEFFQASDEGFRAGFKARRNKPAELIAKHLDKLMRKGQGASSDAEYTRLLESVLGLYRYTDDKDVFRTFYHRALAKRLLLEKSASDDIEKDMLKKLKDQYDAEFGMAEDMFKDLSLSRDMMRDFHDSLSAESAGRSLTAMVLQRSAWPFAVPKTTIDLLPQMQEDLQTFTDYYKKKHQGRILNWDHALGTATLKGRFDPGPKELSVSLYQAIILLMFNDVDEISFADIKEQILLEDAELRRTLQSLACGKLRVLKKVPPGRDVADTDVFRFNADFSDARPKVHINSIQAKVSPEESKRTNASIEGDRKHYLDAAVVRIMKGRKEMKIEELTAETINSVKSHFVPDVQVIKQRIEALVEMEYLARDLKDKKLFRYLA